MSSLLDGIDVADKSTSSKSSGGPDPKVIKGVIAGVLFLLAGVVLAMQFNIIPPIWGGDSAPENSAGEKVVHVPASDEETRKTMERIERDRAEAIRRGAVEGGS